MDANDLYELATQDPQAGIRAVLEELTQGAAFLSGEEQGFVVGVQGNLDLAMPLTNDNVKQLVALRDVLRRRIAYANQLG